VIDTGFTGFLSLPRTMIESLGLPWIFRDVATLGDGSEAIFDMYRAIVIWDSQPQVVDVAASEADPHSFVVLVLTLNALVRLIQVNHPSIL
jgi:predicted aspartyl protease